jgi:hypothetical protein
MRMRYAHALARPRHPSRPEWDGEVEGAPWLCALDGARARARLAEACGIIRRERVPRGGARQRRVRLQRAVARAAAGGHASGPDVGHALELARQRDGAACGLHASAVHLGAAGQAPEVGRLARLAHGGHAAAGTGRECVWLVSALRWCHTASAHERRAKAHHAVVVTPFSRATIFSPCSRSMRYFLLRGSARTTHARAHASQPRRG